MLKINIDYNLEDTVYRQIYNQIVEQIASSNIHPGDKIPSSREMAGVLNINFHTVNKAYQLLRENGIIELSKNKRYIISKKNKTGDAVDDFKKRETDIINEAMVKGLNSDDIIKTVKNILNLKGGGLIKWL